MALWQKSMVAAVSDPDQPARLPGQSILGKLKASGRPALAPSALGRAKAAHSSGESYLSQKIAGQKQAAVGRATFRGAGAEGKWAQPAQPLPVLQDVPRKLVATSLVTPGSHFDRAEARPRATPRTPVIGGGDVERSNQKAPSSVLSQIFRPLSIGRKKESDAAAKTEAGALSARPSQVRRATAASSSRHASRDDLADSSDADDGQPDGSAGRGSSQSSGRFEGRSVLNVSGLAGARFYDLMFRDRAQTSHGVRHNAADLD